MKNFLNVMDENNPIRVSTYLSKEIITYLNGLSLKAKATGGAKLSQVMLIRAMIKAVMETKPDISGVKTEEELIERIKKAIR